MASTQAPPQICSYGLRATQHIQTASKLRCNSIFFSTGYDLPSAGCLPAAITLFVGGSNECVARLNNDAISFNQKLNSTSQNLKAELPVLKLVVFDIYSPLDSLRLGERVVGRARLRRQFCATRDQCGRFFTTIVAIEVLHNDSSFH
ncbi:hypothetical protein OROHE_023274 [Orobanche hederae]